jgi:pyruvate/2-oxoglutarate dehydrogenase complex dihydrolipoamide dehydrogenase (E3) component
MRVVSRTEAVLVVTGRRSNTTSLNLAAAGVTPGERGDLKVGEHYRTAVPHIYAAGDVIGFPGLASTGMQQTTRRELRGRLHSLVHDESGCFWATVHVPAEIPI